MGKRSKRTLTLLAMIFASAGLHGNALREVKAESVWYNTGANCYTVDADRVVAEGNTGKNNNFCLTDQYDTYGDYRFTVSATGTLGLPNEVEHDIGLIPWYIDSDNYILIYLNWSDSDRPSELREIQITGRVNGTQPYIRSGSSYVSKEWNDYWTDGIALASNQTNRIAIEKTTSATDDYVSIKVTVNDSISTYVDFRDPVKYRLEKPKVGVYAYNDTVTFTDFSFIGLSGAEKPATLNQGVGYSLNGSLQYADNAYTFDERSSASLAENGYVTANDLFASPYTVSLECAVEGESDSAALGINAFYENDYNYLYGVVKKENGKIYAGFEGQYVTGENATLTRTSISSLEEIASLSSLSSLNALEVKKSSGKFTLSVNGTETAEYSDAFFVNGASSSSKKKAGFAFYGIQGKVNAFDIADFYDQYSWENLSADGVNYSVSGKTKGSIAYAEGEFTVSSAAVSSGNVGEFAKAYRESDYYGNVSIAATFRGYLDSSVIGLIPFLSDVDNYLEIHLSPTEVVSIVRYGGREESQTYALPEDFVYASEEGHRLSSSVEDGTLTFSVDNAVLFEEDVSYLDSHKKASVGFVVAGSQASVSKPEISGFTPLDPIDRGGFTFFGQRVDSWTYDEENQIIANHLIDGVANGWKATNALYPNTEKTDLFMGAKIRVEQRNGSEWKVGLMPYYKDVDNHVIVWFSQWSDGGCKICVTARFNGRVSGSEWRESSELGIDMLSENYLEAEISQDVLRVYVNQSYTPAFSTTIEGLSSRDMEMAFTGFQVGEGMQAEFSEFTMISDSRVYGFEEKPVIEEIGTRVVSGTIGQEVKLPIYTATNSQGDYLNALITVYDPNNQAVDVSFSKFTPSLAGDYRVVITCTDDWGNSADPIEYVISVSDGFVDPVDPIDPIDPVDPVDPTDPTSPNLGLIIGLSVGGAVVLIGGIVAAVLIIKKKKA